MKIKTLLQKLLGEEPEQNSVRDRLGQPTDDEGDTVTIPVVELFDENGEKLLFELLDTLEYRGEKYSLLTPYFEGQEEYEPLEEPADVFVMKELDGEDGEPLLETVEDEDILCAVYDLFKTKHEDDFEFKE